MGCLYLFTDVSHRCQYSQYIQEAFVVVVALDWAAAVAFG
jgi:hypothetical protein